MNPFVGEVYEHKTFFSRLHHFVIASDAFVVVPGGIGTLLELTMVWQLLQVRNLHGTPLVVVNGRKAVAFPAFLYALVLTRGSASHPAFDRLPPANPNAHLH